jgi:hypothetical protein
MAVTYAQGRIIFGASADTTPTMPITVYGYNFYGGANAETVTLADQGSKVVMRDKAETGMLDRVVTLPIPIHVTQLTSTLSAGTGVLVVYASY